MPSGVDQLLENARQMMQEHEEMMEKLQQEMFGPSMDLSFPQTEQQRSSSWKETKEGQVFEMDYDPKSSEQFDISIQDQMIVLTKKQGQLGQSSSSFSMQTQSISIPRNLDARHPRFEQKDGKLRIYFKRIKEKAKSREGVI